MYEPNVPLHIALQELRLFAKSIPSNTHLGMEKKKRFTVMKRRDFFVRKIYTSLDCVKKKLKIEKKENIIYCLNIFFHSTDISKCLSVYYNKHKKKIEENFLNGFVYGLLFCCNITTLVTQLFSSSLFCKVYRKSCFERYMCVFP